MFESEEGYSSEAAGETVFDTTRPVQNITPQQGRSSGTVPLVSQPGLCMRPSEMYTSLQQGDICPHIPSSEAGVCGAFQPSLS